MILMILGVLLLILLGVAIALIIRNPPSNPFDPPTDEGSIEVVFCPACKEVFHDLVRGGGDIECAIYDFSEETALLFREAEANVITDDEDGGPYGTPFVHYALMHNKFCVINGSTVVTGSYNPTKNGADSRNNLLIINSSLLADNYHSEFLFLSGSRRGKIIHRLLLNGSRVENYFCPADDCEEALVRELDRSEESIHYLVFSFTSNPVRAALERAEKRGVIVEGICDSSQYNVRGGECERLGAAIWTRPGLLHHKVFIIDEKVVTTGSYNPSASGNERNKENFLIIEDSLVANSFMLEYADAYSLVHRR